MSSSVLLARLSKVAQSLGLIVQKVFWKRTSSISNVVKHTFLPELFICNGALWLYAFMQHFTLVIVNGVYLLSAFFYFLWRPKALYNHATGMFTPVFKQLILIKIICKCMCMRF